MEKQRARSHSEFRRKKKSIVTQNNEYVRKTEFSEPWKDYDEFEDEDLKCLEVDWDFSVYKRKMIL